MIIQNTTIITEWEYPQNNILDEEGKWPSKKTYFLKIEIPIPGGVAVYKIATTKEINESLETAISLQEKKK